MQPSNRAQSSGRTRHEDHTTAVEGSAVGGAAGGAAAVAAAAVAAAAALSSSVLGFLRGRPRFAGGLFFFASSAASSSAVRIWWTNGGAGTRRKGGERDSQHDVGRDEGVTRLGNALLTFRGRPRPRFGGGAGASAAEVPTAAASASTGAAGAGAAGSTAGAAAVSPEAVSGFLLGGRPRFLGADFDSTCMERRGSAVCGWENCGGRAEPGRC